LETKQLHEYIGMNVSVIYDPYDMSRVLVTDHEKIRLIGREARLHSRALADATEGSRMYLNQVFAEKKELFDEMAKRSDDRKTRLKKVKIDNEMVLLDPSSVKELKQQAEDGYLLELVTGKRDEDDEYSIWDQL
ncbi:MAG: Mu transposase C-terminal domain-containing protein, partial [Chitinophagaceae bacterium]|nr:Mu transposase C-terminal domain-containing protein [Chitinophagaceae bacterium]